MRRTIFITTTLLGLYAGLPAAATGHDATDLHETAKQAQTLQTVIVTGTRTATRTALDSLSPVDVLTAQDLADTGAPDLDTALRMLLPEFNFPQPSQLGATDATMPAQLRGLSPDETLVLINGKRQHTTSIVNVDGPMIGRGSSPVDLGAIPIDAIARIEVLRSGAAAQYGSDAIAGVINIILKGGAKHGSVHVSRGRYDGGQGLTWHGGANGGFALGSKGWVHVSFDGTTQQPTNHIGPTTLYPGDPKYGTRAAHYGLPHKIVKQGAVNAQYALDANTTLYGFSVFNKRDVDAGAAFHSLSTYDSVSPAAAAVYPDGFLPMKHSAIRDDTTVLGVRGHVGPWHYDISASTGGNHAKMRTTQSFNYSLGTDSPTAFYDGTLSLRQDIVNADFNREFAPSWADSLNVAWGLAWRKETFTLKQGDAASFAGMGAQGAFGFRPNNAGSHSQRNRSAYVDLEADITHRFSAGLAARHEHYSDFGHTTSWKLSARYALTPAFALRGTASTGFRAPSLQQQFYSSTTVEYLNNKQGYPVHYIIGTYPVSDPVAVALGAEPLQPEKSRQLGFGFVFTPAAGPQVTLDLYQIDIRDRIILSGDLVGDEVRDYLASAGLPGVNGGRFFTNATRTRTRGADLVGTWTARLPHSYIRFTGAYNRNRTRIQSIRPNPPQLGLAGLVLPIINRPTQGLITVGTPRDKGSLAAAWHIGHWVLDARVTRYGRWSVLGTLPEADQTYDARALVDMALHYRAGHWHFTLGGNNVTNAYPEKNNSFNDFWGIIPYPFSSPFGFNGRYWYTSVAYQW